MLAGEGHGGKVRDPLGLAGEGREGGDQGGGGGAGGGGGGEAGLAVEVRHGVLAGLAAVEVGDGLLADLTGVKVGEIVHRGLRG